MQIITFDEKGVSGHPNHISTYKGVQLSLISFSKKKISMTGLKLQTTNVFRKFFGVLDLPLSLLSDNVVINFNLLKVLKGMQAHKSQNVWYRILFVLFSRYTYMNTFVKIAI